LGRSLVVQGIQFCLACSLSLACRSLPLLSSLLPPLHVGALGRALINAQIAAGYGLPLPRLGPPSSQQGRCAKLPGPSRVTLAAGCHRATVCGVRDYVPPNSELPPTSPHL